MDVGDMLDLNSAAFKSHAKYQQKAEKAKFLGGIEVGGFGIPSQFLGLDLRTASQKADQQLPGRYLDEIQKLIKKLDEVLDTVGPRTQKQPH